MGGGGGIVTGAEVVGVTAVGAVAGGAVVVVGGRVVGVVVVGGACEFGTDGGADFAAAEVPGCSRATTIPKNAATMPDPAMAKPVNRRSRASARARIAGDNRSRLVLTTEVARCPVGTGGRGP